MLIRHGQVHYWDVTEQTWVPANVGLGSSVPTFYANAYDDLTVTVPAPTDAPVLTAIDSIFGGGTYTAGHTYEFAYSYIGWTGESSLSPVTSVVATGTQVFAILPVGVIGTKAAACKIYARDVTAGHSFTYQRNDDGGGDANADTVQFGDDGAFGGAMRFYVTTGGAHPGTNNAQTSSAASITAPTVAPIVTSNGAVPASTTLYPAFSYVGADGLETALSPTGSSITTSAGTGGHWLTFRITKEPPSGAVFAKLYLSTNGTSWKLQQTVPIDWVTTDIHTWNSSGASPSPGSPQSTISGIQQAVDAAVAAGGSTVEIPAGVYSSQVPLIFRIRTMGGTLASGLRVRGQEMAADGSITKINYTGTQSGITFLVNAVSHFQLENIRFSDPNSRVKYGWGFADFTGGQSFDVRGRQLSIEAGAADSIGGVVGLTGRSSSTHIASELEFERVRFYAQASGFDRHGGQTGDITFRRCTFQSAGNSSSAKSYGIRDFGGFDQLKIYGETFATGGRTSVLLSGEQHHPSGGIAGQIYVRGMFNESNVTQAHFVSSSENTNGGIIDIAASRLSDQTSGGAYAFVVNSPTKITIGNGGMVRGDILLRNFARVGYATFSVLGQPLNGYDNFTITPQYGNFKVVNPDYRASTISSFVGTFGLVNESNQASTLGTNAAGDLTLSPYSLSTLFPSGGILNFNAGDVLLTHSSNKLTLSGGTFAVPDDAYDATTWNGSTDVPTKNAVRDKIEALAAGIGGGDALTSNPLSQFASTTSAQLASVLSDESGSSGGFVRAVGASLSQLTGLAIRSSGAAFDLTIATSEVLTAGRTLSIVMNDAARTLTLAGNATISGTNTGDQTITLTGDVTGSGTGSFAASIGANKVTLGMMATIAQDRIIGGATGAGTATPTALSVLPTGCVPAFTGDVTNSAGSLAMAIGAGKVTNAMLAGSIAYSKLSLTGAILNADLAGSIAASKLVGTDIVTLGTVTAGIVGVGSGTVANGANNDVTSPVGMIVSLTLSGPTGAYSISGFSNPVDGKILFLNCNISQTLTLKHDSGSVAGASGGTFGQRITIPGGADKTFAAGALVACIFMYQRAIGGGAGYWKLFSASDGTTAGF